jgi:glycosyltransferase involved in cell wall biosynthesis
MPRVLILCEYAALNGAEQSMLSTLGGIAAAGFEVHVAAPAAGPLSEALRRGGVQVVPFELHDAHGLRRPLSELRAALSELLRARPPDLIHANSLAMGRLAGPVAADLALPSIAHLRDIVSLSRQAVADLNCHARLLAVSSATREFHIAQGVSADKLLVAYNGVDLLRFRPRPPSGFLHREFNLSTTVPLIGSIGQISLRKGLDVLAASLAQIRSPVSFCWLIVGRRFSDKLESRQFEERLHQVAAGSLAGKVRFLGVREDVDRLLSDITLLVHPARQEPLGRVLLEAAAAGLPIVATDVGGTREIFPPEREAALLVPPDDVPATTAAIARLLSDEHARRRLGENARSRAVEAFDLSQRVDGLVRHYQDLAGKRLM